MDTVNAKKRWMTIYWRVNKFLKKSHIVTHPFFFISRSKCIALYQQLVRTAEMCGAQVQAFPTTH
jgi:hypothetical protein